METYYLVDFENVHDQGIENIGLIKKDEYVYLFYTPNAEKMKIGLAFPSGNKNVVPMFVAAGDQSLDKHLVSYLGYLLATKGKDKKYIIITGDNGYDNVIKFWKERGYANISKSPKIHSDAYTSKEDTSTKQSANNQSKNALINKGLDKVVDGSDRTALNEFVQHRLKEMGYESSVYNKVCSIVVKCSGAENKLSDIHNALKSEYSNAPVVYEDVKKILGEFSKKTAKSNDDKGNKIRAFYDNNLKKKIYVDNREATVNVLVNAKNISEVNDNLLKIYKNGQIVKNMKEKLKPLLTEIFKQ